LKQLSCGNALYKLGALCTTRIILYYFNSVLHNGPNYLECSLFTRFILCQYRNNIKISSHTHYSTQATAVQSKRIIALYCLIAVVLSVFAFATFLFSQNPTPLPTFPVPNYDDALHYISALRNLTCWGSHKAAISDAIIEGISKPTCITILSLKNRTEYLPITLASLFRFISVDDLIRTRIIVMPTGLPEVEFVHEKLVRSLAPLGVRLVDLRSVSALLQKKLDPNSVTPNAVLLVLMLLTPQRPYTLTMLLRCLAMRKHTVPTCSSSRTT